MRFTLCSIASAALLLGSCPEPVQATSLLAQYDSQGAFNELLQLDAGLDLEADVEGSPISDNKWASKPKMAENMAKATEDFVNHLAKLHVEYLHQKSKKGQPSQSGYCKGGAELEAEVKKVAPGIDQKVEAIRDAIDKANESRVRISEYYQTKTLASKEDLAVMVLADTDYMVEENDEKFDSTVLKLQADSLKEFKKELGEDFDKVNGTIKMKDDVKQAAKDNARAKTVDSVNLTLITAINAFAGLQSGTVKGGNDTPSYYGTELYARTLIQQSCQPKIPFKEPTKEQVMTVSGSDQAFLHNLEVLM